MKERGVETQTLTTPKHKPQAYMDLYQFEA